MSNDKISFTLIYKYYGMPAKLHSLQLQNQFIMYFGLISFLININERDKSLTLNYQEYHNCKNIL